MRAVLERMGLTENEIKVYQMLLSEGASLVGKITQKTGIHRRNVYDCLERLIQKGFVAYIKENNRKVYALADPAGLQARLEQQQQDFLALLPTLQARYHALTERKETLFFRGHAGIKQVLLDQITAGQEILVLATSVDVNEVLKHFFPRYQLLRKEHKIPTRMLFDAAQRSTWKRLRLPLAELRFLADVNRSSMSQYIYADTVAIIVWGQDPLAIVIRQKEIASGFRDNFEAIWRNAKP